MYPEHWRKPEVYEGDHNDTWDPFQVVRLEEIANNGRDVFIRVRKMYRPHDTHLKHEEARKKPLTMLYMSDEVARMYPKDFAHSRSRVSMEDVVAPCYVKVLNEFDDEAEADRVLAGGWSFHP